jgi:hydroxyacylglutathione hydrolase
MKIELIPLLTDNYSFLLVADDGTVGVVDPAEFSGTDKKIQSMGGRLNFIINTHHHWDHVGANESLKRRYGATIVGPGHDAARIPGIDREVNEGDTFLFGHHRAQVLFTPGHTKGHICYWFEKESALFCGDTLFSLGCGRLFEGTPAQMWRSLDRLRSLPDDTKVYCAHEYTEQNGKFAKTIDDSNVDLLNKLADVRRDRANGVPTIPANLGEEKITNPFLRPFDLAIRNKLGMVEATDVEVFKEIRRLKDDF